MKGDVVLGSFLNYGLQTLPGFLMREDSMSPREKRRKISWKERLEEAASCFWGDKCQ